MSVCKRYRFAVDEEPEHLPASFVTRDDVEIGRIVGERKSTEDKRVTEFRCRLRYPPHNVPEHDLWFQRKNMRCARLLRRYNADLDNGQFVEGVYVPR